MKDNFEFYAILTDHQQREISAVKRKMYCSN